MEDNNLFNGSIEASAMQHSIQEINDDGDFKVLMQVEREMLYWDKQNADRIETVKQLQAAKRDAVNNLRNKYANNPEIKSFIAFDTPMSWKKPALAAVCLIAVIGIGALGFNVLANGEDKAEAAVVALGQSYGIAPNDAEKHVEETAAPAAPTIKQPPEATATNSAEVLSAWLNSHGGSHLLSCVDELVTHPRWVEAVSIARQETSLCTKGVAKFNNCGGIKSRKADRTWRQYANKCDGMLDIAFLIERDDYKAKTISEMAGRYCGSGPECRVWPGNIMETVDEIRGLLSK